MVAEKLEPSEYGPGATYDDVGYVSAALDLAEPQRRVDRLRREGGAQWERYVHWVQRFRKESPHEDCPGADRRPWHIEWHKAR